jgi:hypothetical protein
MSENNRPEDSGLPPFPYEDGEAVPLEDAGSNDRVPSAQPHDFSHVAAQEDRSVPSIGDAVDRFAQASDSQAEAIKSLSESVGALSESFTSQQAEPSISTPAPDIDSPQQLTDAAPQIDLSKVTASLDRIFTAITAGAGPSDRASADPVKEAATRQYDIGKSNGQENSGPSAIPKAQSADLTGEGKPYASPNLVPGKDSGGDVVDAKLRRGEFVMRPEAVKSHGVDFMEKINAGEKPPAGHQEKHAWGGIVGMARGAMNATNKFVATNQGSYATYQATSVLNSGGILGKSAAGAISGAVSGAATGNPAMMAIGAASGAVVSAFKAVGDSAKAAANQLQMYDANIAEANALAEHRQVHGDIKRAEIVGKDVSQYTETTSKISQHGQNLEAITLKAGLAVLNPILELLEPILAFLTDFLKVSITEIMAALAAVVPWLDGVSTVLDPIAKALADGAASLRQVAINGQPDVKGMDVDHFMDRFLKGHGVKDEEHEKPPVQQRPPRQRRVVAVAGGGLMFAD